MEGARRPLYLAVIIIPQCRYQGKTFTKIGNDGGIRRDIGIFLDAVRIRQPSPAYGVCSGRVNWGVSFSEIGMAASLHVVLVLVAQVPIRNYLWRVCT